MWTLLIGILLPASLMAYSFILLAIFCSVVRLLLVSVLCCSDSFLRMSSASFARPGSRRRFVALVRFVVDNAYQREIQY